MTEGWNCKFDVARVIKGKKTVIGISGLTNMMCLISLES